ncbi:hypothetical protein LCGC14_2373210, partial [marine sediment metagenome]
MRGMDVVVCSRKQGPCEALPTCYETLAEPGAGLALKRRARPGNRERTRGMPK